MEPEEELPIEIPYQVLSPESFNGLVEEYILREGTDYGHGEVTLAEKKAALIKQLQAGHIKIVFSAKTQDCTFIKKDQGP